MGKGKIIAISGPSGVGKTTLYKRLLDDFKDDLTFSISATTRPKRHNEVNGEDYYFMSEKEFIKKTKNDEFVEWAIVYNNYYGTLKTEVNRIIDSGKNCFLDLDVQGALNIKKSFPASHLIFILPPSPEALKERIINRKTDAPEVIQIRIDHSLKEIEFSQYYDYKIVNDDVESAYTELKILMQNILG